MDKIANISVRDISKVGFAKNVSSSSPTFFNIFAWNFQDVRESAFRSENGGRWHQIQRQTAWAMVQQMNRRAVNHKQPLGHLSINNNVFVENFWCQFLQGIIRTVNLAHVTEHRIAHFVHFSQINCPFQFPFHLLPSLILVGPVLNSHSKRWIHLV